MAEYQCPQWEMGENKKERLQRHMENLKRLFPWKSNE